MTKSYKFSIESEPIEKGAALFAGMLTLVILSLLAITSMQGSTLEERMAANTKDVFVAFEAAEAALAEAEQDIKNGIYTLSQFQANANGMYENNSDTIWEDIDWATSEAQTASNPDPNIFTSAPKYVIQHLGETPDDPVAPTQQVQLFRITVRGTGKSNDSIVILQSTYCGLFGSAHGSEPIFGRHSWRQIEF